MTSVQEPKVSVCVTTYNHAPFIRQAIDSVLMQQTSFAVEIVIGEDDSSDGTRAIVEGYAAAHPDRIRLLLRKRADVIFYKGQPTGRANFAKTIESARGQYVALLEGDDYWTDPRKLQRQVDYMDAHPECAACFHPVDVVYEDGRTATHRTHQPMEKEQFDLADVVEKGFEIPTCSYLFRRGLFGPFPDWFYRLLMGDLPLHLLNAEHGTTAFLPESMGAYRIHGGGVCSFGFAAKAMPSEQARRRLEGAIEYYHTINTHLGRRFEEVILQKVSMIYYDLAWVYQREGNTKMMRDCLLAAARLGRVFNRYTPKSYVVKAWAFAFIPGLAALRRRRTA